VLENPCFSLRRGSASPPAQNPPETRELVRFSPFPCLLFLDDDRTEPPRRCSRTRPKASRLDRVRSSGGRSRGPRRKLSCISLRVSIPTRRICFTFPHTQSTIRSRKSLALFPGNSDKPSGRRPDVPERARGGRRALGRPAWYKSIGDFGRSWLVRIDESEDLEISAELSALTITGRDESGFARRIWWILKHL